MAAWQDLYRKVRGAIPVSLRNLAELHLWNDGFLRATGWARSRRAGTAVDAKGAPLPWYTYPAIAFLETRDVRGCRLFEFGMGNSTLWWSRRTDRIVTCEGDKAWYDRVAARMPPSVEAIVVPDSSDLYVRAAADRGEPFDILVIDGRRRVQCCRESLPFLSERGVVIWDDYHRDYYREGGEMLRAAGFRELPFWGMTPVTARQACTSIFYRPDNCLGI